MNPLTTLRHHLTAILPAAFMAVMVSQAAADLKPLLLPPPHTDGGKPLMQALLERQSQREFSPKALESQELADLLWAAFGINRSAIDHRTAPSAMNSQEIDIYVALADGVFLYNPKANRLDPVAEGDMRAKTGGQDFVKVAPVELVFVADLARMVKAKPEAREPYAWADTGSISQNVYLYCASAGMATVVHELGERQPLVDAWKLRPEQRIILAQAVGYPAQKSRGSGPPAPLTKGELHFCVILQSPARSLPGTTRWQIRYQLAPPATARPPLSPSGGQLHRRGSMGM
jgi:nitroreductase